tara:strand:- start:623 stop:934 length:312 start_codon:yes stop_codon:yes gene_type:complete
MSTDITEDIKLDEKLKKKITQPSKYNVVMLNDEVTPMDWVMSILKEIYKHSSATSEELTMRIHTDGNAIVGTYAFEIAEQKATETINASRNHGFPLTVKIDEA